ncbi:ATP-binding protein [Conexibacter woesei]|uniref:Putative anti-sigma regulatory factor, serine/threonine protein kinase n=1 Tax=Conexibacter woesei (strain DSM 14684 / CCUG 47730 / CIP 108061 / JCM 11494 / NBRC 100937 / ID131577) TaxID=469383 RepID=D3EZ92_CONWI|nr:ATP-binding protein [Conexibacter woesei]ADB51857.1 putative anti-sigma regulatory factor, serine/threonine protein kinase [Conexibacter woesei DSM 14684]
MAPDGEVRVEIASDDDVVAARQAGRRLAESLGLATTDLTLVATAISEVARNITAYAGSGEIVVRRVELRGRSGIEVVARDEGPGIDDIERALQDGYTTGGGLGLGLPGARRLMDDFAISSRVGAGTTVTMTKWVPY